MQLLYPAAYPDGISFVRTFAGTGAIHVGELPGGGWCRIDGQPIQDEAELHAVIPRGTKLTEALKWWSHRDDEESEWEPPAVTWKKGRLVYVENGAELTSHAEIIQAYPEDSPFQHAALEWFAERQYAQHQSTQRENLQTGVIGGNTAAPKRSHHPAKKAAPKAKSPQKQSTALAKAPQRQSTVSAEGYQYSPIAADGQ